MEQLGSSYKFEIIANTDEILKYGVIKTPALVVNDKVIFEGRVPSILEMPDILRKAFSE